MTWYLERVGPLLLLGLAGCSILRGTGDLGAAEGEGPSGEETPEPSEGDATSSVPDAGEGEAGTAPPTVSPCGQPHLFCDDFDRSTIVTGWGPGGETEAGPVDIDTAVSLSPSHSLRVRLSGNVPGEIASHLEQALTVASTKLEVTADIRVDRGAGTFGEVDYFSLFLEPAPADMDVHGIAIVETPGLLTFQYFQDPGTGAAEIHQDLELPRLEGTWQRFTMRVDYAVSPPVASVTVDGKNFGSLQLRQTAFTGASVEVGAPYVKDNQSTHVIHVDNVVAD